MPWRQQRKYLEILAQSRKSENGVENCNVSPTLLSNPVYFGPQMGKTGPKF